MRGIRAGLGRTAEMAAILSVGIVAGTVATSRPAAVAADDAGLAAQVVALTARVDALEADKDKPKTLKAPFTVTNGSGQPVFVVTATGSGGAVHVKSSGDADLTLLSDFIAESRELLENAEAALLGLELDPDNGEAVNTIFRAFHTIKGTSAFLALDYVTEFAHHAETVLSCLHTILEEEWEHHRYAVRDLDAIAAAA